MSQCKQSDDLKSVGLFRTLMTQGSDVLGQDSVYQTVPWVPPLDGF